MHDSGDSGGPWMRQEATGFRDENHPWEEYRNVLIAITSGGTVLERNKEFHDKLGSDLGYEPYQAWIDQIINES